MVRHSVKRKAVEVEDASLPAEFGESVLVRFYDAKNEVIGDDISVPLKISRDDLTTLLKASLVGDERAEDDEFSMVLSDTGIEVTKTIEHAFAEGLRRELDMSTETTLRISFYSMSPYKVRPVTRLAGSLSGHKGSVVCCAFSGDGALLATGSGDCQVRLWDLNTATPRATLAGHTRSVECLAWSPDGKYLASGSEDKTIRVWTIADCLTSKEAVPKVLKHHAATVTSLAFMPAHLSSPYSPNLLSASRDGSIRIWDTLRATVIAHLDGHTAMVTSVKWSGMMKATFEDKEVDGPFVYSSSRDMTVRVWSAHTGRPLRQVRSHGHWVNALSTNTDALIRYGPFDHTGRRAFASSEEMSKLATDNWEKGFRNLGEERVVTCSDDNTLALWTLLKSDNKIAHMTGHQKAVCHVSFSPNGRHIASAGFDSSIRLWDGRNGKFLFTYRGHVGPVYQVAWSADSRMFVSGSADSTLKVWEVGEHNRKLKEDLPGHADEVYAVDWSPDGARVGSGGKDKMVRIWAH